MSNPEDELREQVELGQALSRLETNPDFQLVIGGFIHEQLINESRNLLSTDEVSKAQALDKVKAANYLRNYFDTVTNVARASQYDIGETE